MDCLSGNLQTWNTNVSKIDQAIVLDQNQPTETNPDKSFIRASKYETPEKAKCFLISYEKQADRNWSHKYITNIIIINKTINMVKLKR